MECVDIAEEEDSFDTNPVELSQGLIEEWTHSEFYHILPIEDLRNVNVNTNIRVFNNFTENQFTLRFFCKGRQQSLERQ